MARHCLKVIRMNHSRSLLVLALFVLLLISGCFPDQTIEPTESPAGFFMGVWHGWIAPLSLIVGIFSDTVRVYEMNNTGWWYDLGFYVAIISGFGGLSLTRKRKPTEHGHPGTMR
jgi:hypothetical protein